MGYTFIPKENHAKAYGRGLRISTKSAKKVSDLIRGKKLNAVKRLLRDLLEQKRSISGKYYTKAVSHILDLLESCEKNADSLGLDKKKLFVHCSVHKGPNFRRRRRKAAFGSTMKSTNVEIILIEKGKTKQKTKAKPKKTEKV